LRLETFNKEKPTIPDLNRVNLGKNGTEARLKYFFFLNIFWCDLPLLAVFIIFVFLPSSGPSYPSSF
jgi:hypothetical protein